MDFCGDLVSAPLISLSLTISDLSGIVANVYSTPVSSFIFVCRSLAVYASAMRFQYFNSISPPPWWFVLIVPSPFAPVASFAYRKNQPVVALPVVKPSLDKSFTSYVAISLFA